MEFFEYEEATVSDFTKSNDDLIASARERSRREGNLIAAACWWRDYAHRLMPGAQGGFPESPYPPDSYGVPMPPPGVAFGAGPEGSTE